ncbi:MAG: HU family DNA-binding protein [Candidatus Parvarchaeum sp.]
MPDVHETGEPSQVQAPAAPVKPEKPKKPKLDLTKEKKLRGAKFVHYLYDSLPQENRMTYKEFEKLFDDVLAAMKAAFLRGQVIHVGDLGRFRVQVLKARVGVNPSTATKIKLGDRKTLKFAVNKKFKDELNK